MLIFSIMIVLILLMSGTLFLNYKDKLKIQKLQNAINIKEEHIKTLHETEQQLQNELIKIKEQLTISFEDNVTGLLGWQLFEDRITQSIRESERYHLTLGLLLVDIDDFKLVNDALNYGEGDALLREAANRLKLCIRQVDSLTRLTNDRFVILLLQLNKPETAVIVAQRILQIFKAPFVLEEQEFYVTVSVGISIYPIDGKKLSDLMRSANHALDLAKKSGKNNFKFYYEKLHVKSLRELALHSLKRENVYQEFLILYQPIKAVNQESIFCMEALLHWEHPKLGLIYPQEIFCYADTQHTLNVISEWLIENACKQFINWRQLGFKPICIGVSISIQQMENSQFIYRISQILKDLSFKPECLLLGIREGGEQVSSDALVKSINMLKYLGIKIAVENFGCSQSFSLLGLKNINVDYIKLHPELIEDVDKSEKTVTLIASIIEFASSMSMQVIVQGVSRAAQVEVLTALGCGLMQGNLLGAPASAKGSLTKLRPV